MFNNVMSLAIPVICLVFLIGITEQIEKALEIIFKLKKNEIKAIFIILIIGYALAWVGDWRFFTHLDFKARYDWVDWMLSAMTIAAGSAPLERKFDVINRMPHIFASLSSAVRKGKVDDMPQHPEVPYMPPTVLPPTPGTTNPEDLIQDDGSVG